MEKYKKYDLLLIIILWYTVKLLSLTEIIFAVCIDTEENLDFYNLPLAKNYLVDLRYFF